MSDDNITIDHELRGKTEWDDILIKHGIKEAPAPVITEDDLSSAVAEAATQRASNYQQDRYKNMSVDEFDELDDEHDNDHKLIQQYRQQRIQELKQQQQTERYGTLMHIGEAAYKREVSESSVDCTVIVCLFEFSVPACQLLLKHLSTLATKYKSIKFVRIEAQKAIPNYPSSSCPTVLVYQNTHITHQYVNIDVFGGPRLTPDTIENRLGTDGVLGIQYDREYRDKTQRTDSKRINTNKHTAALSSDESDNTDSD